MTNSLRHLVCCPLGYKEKNNSRLMTGAIQRHDVHPQLLHYDQEDTRIAFGQSVSGCQVVENRRYGGLIEGSNSIHC